MASTPDSSIGDVDAEDSLETLLNAANEAPGFGLNGRALILQAAQRAAKKHKASHPDSQGSDFPRLHTSEPLDSHPTAINEQQIAQPAISAGTETRAGGSQQDTDATVAPDTVQLAQQLTVQTKTDKAPSAPRRSEALSTAATDALIDGLDPHDQPLVAYINRSSVPRILRQGVAKRLAGQQLARLLQDAGVPVTPSAARSLEAAAVRKFAAQAALAQEMCIYRKGVGKQAYMNNAARQQAWPSYLPAEARPAQQQGAAEGGSELLRPASTSYAAAPQHSNAEAYSQALARVPEQHLRQTDNSHSCATAPQRTPGKQGDPELACSMSAIPGAPICKEDGVPLANEARRDAAEGLCLKEAEIDWSGDMSLPQQGQGDGDDSLAAEDDQSSWSDADSEEYGPEGALLDIDSHVLSPRRRSSEKRRRGSAQAEVGAQSSAEPDVQHPGKIAAGGPPPLDTAPAVQKATLRFVKAILNPLYAAQVVSRAVYKFVLLKVTNKVMQGHRADVDATFLVAESGRIQRLVQDYIKHCQLHGIDD